MDLPERKRERINRIDQELYLILAAALMRLVELQSHQDMGGHSSLRTEVWDTSSEGRVLDGHTNAPSSREHLSEKLALLLRVSRLQDARLAGREDRRGEWREHDSPSAHSVPGTCPRGVVQPLLDAHGSPRAHWLRRVSRLVCGWLCAKGVLPRCPCGKESACNAGDVASAPGSGRSPGGGNGNPLQYSCLGNPMDRRAWQGTVHGVAKNLTWLSG